MPQPLTRFKPAASRRVHLLAAALLWTIVGAALLGAGLAGLRALDPVVLAGVVVLAVGVGLLKGRFILWRAADRVVARIVTRGDDRCLGGVLSWRTWVFVVLMVAVGRLLRASPLAVEIVGAVYVAVGAALLIGSGRFWGVWWWRASG